MSIFEPYNMPFAAALLLMGMLAIIQIIGLGDILGDADVDVDMDAETGGQADLGGGFASLIGLGRLPLMIWLALFLGLFAALGVSIQLLAANLAGAPLDRWLAAVLAAGAALPVTGGVAKPLARILPHDETTAVSTDTLVGRRAVITDGTARTGSPARARVHDIHGQAHHVMVEPHDAGVAIAAGEPVLLVRREADLFFATALTTHALSPQ